MERRELLDVKAVCDESRILETNSQCLRSVRKLTKMKKNGAKDQVNFKEGKLIALGINAGQCGLEIAVCKSGCEFLSPLELVGEGGWAA